MLKITELLKIKYHEIDNTDRLLRLGTSKLLQLYKYFNIKHNYNETHRFTNIASN